ncbi:MAG: adenylate/guanylate cyclase domain-containing protein [Fimbriimonadaceae bacterium]
MQEELLEQRNPTSEGLSEDEIQEMLVLATRLREQTGGELDDEAIVAVAEATGAPLDYVRLVVRTLPEKQGKKSVFSHMRSSYLSFDPNTRKLVAGSMLGLCIGVTSFLSGAIQTGDAGFFSIFSVIFAGLAGWNAISARETKWAIAIGALAGGASQLSLALLGFIQGLMMPNADITGSNPGFFILALFVGALIGGAGHALFRKNRKRLGMIDPAADRQILLEQLVDIQTKLKSDERFVTYLSVDVVGSTRMKTKADPLNLEFTFNEYHRYIESIVKRNGGEIHSTAGDGVIGVFEDPRKAFQAGKAIQGGLFEFNAFRNKLDDEIELRAGVHTGNVLAPGQEAKNVNFAHVIDVAAHIQHESPVGGLGVSSTTATYLGGLGAVSEERITVEDFEVAIWRPRKRVLPQPAGAAESPAG